MEEKAKRVVQIEIDDQVKKLTVEGIDKDAQVVMRQELSDEDLNCVAGGGEAGKTGAARKAGKVCLKKQF